jgi:flagellar assembly protein FliH
MSEPKAYIPKELNAEERAPAVQPFKFRELSRPGTLKKTSVKELVGSGRPREDQRFRVDPLLQGIVPVEQEMAAEIERRVEERWKVERERAKQEGYEAGFEKGMTEGAKVGKMDFESHARALSARWESFLEEAEGLKSQLLQANLSYLMDLLMLVARKVLLRELKGDPAYLERLLQALIERSHASGQIEIFVNPVHFEEMRALKPELLDRYDLLTNILVEAREDVPPQGIVLETSRGILDARLETLLESIEDELQAGIAELPSPQEESLDESNPQ